MCTRVTLYQVVAVKIPSVCCQFTLIDGKGSTGILVLLFQLVILVSEHEVLSCKMVLVTLPVARVLVVRFGATLITTLRR